MERTARRIGLVVLCLLTWRFAREPLDGSSTGSFLHLPDLVFHEAGHVLFSPFGEFIGVLGGSLFQLLVPLACALSFALQYRNWFASAVCTWWIGQNLVDLAPYVADARRLQLVLLGGRTGAEVEGHDWEYILTSLGWLHLDLALGRAAQVAGTVVMVGAIAWAFLILRRHAEEG
jgi:hypothetical protein